MRAPSLLVAAVLALAACRSNAPAPTTRVATPELAPLRAATSAPASPALAPPVADAPDYRELVRALAEGVEIDEPRTTEDHADPTRSVLTGIVRDFETGEALVGVTVIAASPTVDGSQAAITDENGNYFLELQPAIYTATFYYLDQTREEADLVLAPGKAIRLADTISSGPETLPPVGPPPLPESDYVNIPVPGRTFEAVLGVAAGSQEDGEGVSFSSHCGLENVYIVDSDDEPANIEIDQ
jgi:hypothetical protein